MIPDLFTQPPTMDQALQLRDRAMETVERNAGEVFGEKARAYVLKYLREHGPTSGEDLTEACKAAGIQAHDDRAFGPIYMALSRAKLIERIGTCKRKRGHGTGGGSVWQVVQR